MKVKKQISWALKRLILNIKSSKEYVKGRKTSFFLFFRRLNKAAFLGLWPIR